MTPTVVWVVVSEKHERHPDATTIPIKLRRNMRDERSFPAVVNVSLALSSDARMNSGSERQENDHGREDVTPERHRDTAAAAARRKRPAVRDERDERDETGDEEYEQGEAAAGHCVKLPSRRRRAGVV